MKKTPPKPIRRVAPVTKPSSPKVLWRGPYEDGITNSLLSKFLNCRHRFWLKVVLGLSEDEGFRHALEFGQLWHEAEEAHAARQDWKAAIGRYADKLRGQYPTAEAEIRKWSNVAKAAFPAYIDYWRGHQDTKKRVPLVEESAFKVPLRLPSGRIIFLRGKFDSVFGIKSGRAYEGWLQENKSKGTIDEVGLQKSTPKNLQTMIYQTALRSIQMAVAAGEDGAKYLDHGGNRLVEAFNQGLDIKGTIYNVVRRPLSDQRAIRQKVKETEKQFFHRLETEIRKKPDYYFLRWKINLPQSDIVAFHRESLLPILETVCDWWDSIQADPMDPFKSPHHFVFPFGVEQGLTMAFRGGGRGDFFDYLTTGTRTGLVRVETLFPELDPHK